MCEFGTYSCGFFLILQDKLQNAINVMKRIITALIIIIASLTAYAQMPGFGKKPSAATWKSRIEMTGDKSGKLILTMTAGKGWHIYGFDVEAGGPKTMTADFSKSTGIEFKGELTPSVAPVKTLDELFGINVTYWEGKVVFTRDFIVTDAAKAKILGTITYQGCNGDECQAPKKYNVSILVGSAGSAKK